MQTGKGLVAATIGLTALVLAGGCSNTIGPRALEGGRRGYNEAVQVTTNEQLLKNIVRLRHDEMPFFLDIRQINTSYENFVQLDADLSAHKPINVGKEKIVDHHLVRWGMGALWRFEERPTITYVPLQGQKFAQEYLTPIDQDILLKLYFSGWTIDRILRLCVQEMNGIRNAPTATGPTPRQAPEYETFLEICHVLKKMQDRNLISLQFGKRQGEPVAVLSFSPDDNPSCLDQQLRELLGLPADSNQVIFTRRIAARADEITITPRTVMGILFYVSQGVAVTDGDKRKGNVVITEEADGKPFDWQQVLGNLFKVEVSKGAPPSDVLVAARRGRNYYYIPSNDIESKRTFHMIGQLTNLVGGKFDSPAPILTVPVR